MKRLLFSMVILIFLDSCNFREKFQERVTMPANQHGVIFSAETSCLAGTAKNKPENAEIHFTELDSMQILQQLYLQNDRRFDLIKLQSLWHNIINEPEISQIAGKTALQWFRVTGFLFQLTGEARYTGEMERLVWSGLSESSEVLDSVVAPYVFTKNVDHIHVNFFLPSEISYEHSLGGAVRIVQETGFPASGSIRLIFGMKTKRYIEVFVRIPKWAKGASVEVKGVKYFTHPGRYCMIAKKWKDGDVVEIEFPMNNLPGYFKNEPSPNP